MPKVGISPHIGATVERQESIDPRILSFHDHPFGVLVPRPWFSRCYVAVHGS